ncbi:serine/threonine-protein kinase [Streptomyces morookaense]|uniref:non-specific serine/threonine protein kinase n=1 Tax=Streptomyces morookaense TaxID=1970 RepID=A0A7Y7B181_STRMO|nr:serine/threonine-protein kinase [Streptomyces morookaense]NVK77180.1 protein kinase [Streptomyces morookaense]GHF17332.1 serine/threonine protein kinase [Streptomyces morookaense]
MTQSWPGAWPEDGAAPGPDIGRLIAGRYRLLERIGRGGMGTVWRAEDELLARQVAVKRLHVSPGLDDEDLATLYERTRREARSAARINHPNVVVVHDVVDDGGLPCIVMEYVPSTTLGDVLKRGTIGPEEAARIGRGMIAALRAAHAAGVLHRDVKPGNVLLGADGRVVLTDFGIAQSTGTSTLTKTGEMVGSIDYIAPERVKGGKPGPAADLWALGATLYQALEGRPPFRRDTGVETAYSIAVDPLPPPRHAGPLTRLIETLLAKDPSLRPPAELVEQILTEPGVLPDGGRGETVAEPAPAPIHTDGGAWPEAGTAGMAVAEAPAPPVPQETAVPQPETGTHQHLPGAGQFPDASQGTAAVTVPSPRPEPPARAKGRRRGLLWGSAAAVAAAGLVAGAYVFLQQGDDSGETRTEPAVSPSRSPSRSATPGPSPSWTPPPVPQGYRLVNEDKLGVSFPVPDGWHRDAATSTSTEVNYLDATGRVGIKINVLEFASSDPVQHFKDVEEQTKKNVDKYKRGRLQATSFRGQSAAVWEFTFDGSVRSYRAIDLGFGREGGKEYAIYLSAPAAEWDRHRPVFDVVRDGFRPAKDR